MMASEHPTEGERAALAWMRAQAKAIDPAVNDTFNTADLARIISGALRYTAPINEPPIGELLRSIRNAPITLAPKELDIAVHEWHHQCADGCCDSWGTEIAVNGVEVGTDLGNVDDALEAVLQHLGYVVRITNQWIK